MSPSDVEIALIRLNKRADNSQRVLNLFGTDLSEARDRLFKLEQSTATTQEFMLNHVKDKEPIAIRELKDRIGRLEIVVENLRTCLRTGDLPKGEPEQCFGQELEVGAVFKSNKLNDSYLYIVINGRDGYRAVKRFPSIKYYRPIDLKWDNLEQVGRVEDIISP